MCITQGRSGEARFTEDLSIFSNLHSGDFRQCSSEALFVETDDSFKVLTLAVSVRGKVHLGKAWNVWIHHIPFFGAALF